MGKKLLSLIVVAAFSLLMTSSALALVVTNTTNSSDLITGLGGGGPMTINSVSINNGASSQFGTYTGFTSPPVTLGDGVVLSSGLVVDTTAASHSTGDSPSTDEGVSGTAEFNSYGPGHITNFGSSYDVAALQVNFTLSAPSQVGFQFIFGSVEYPVYVNSYTDAFLAFLDGTGISNQIVFDASNNAVQVGSTFASALTILDTNSAFYDPHGLVKLQTFTVNQLAVGNHTLTFEVGDVNDHILDSAVFISNFHAGPGGGGTNPIPEPSTFLLLGAGLAGVGLLRRRFKK